MKNQSVLERLSAANPISGLEHVEADEYERFVSYFEARRVAMIDSRETRSDTVAVRPKKRVQPVLVFTVALVAVVLAVGGSVLWLAGGAAEDPATEVTQPAVPTTAPEATTLPATTVPVVNAIPTLTFDGETASYSGPETFDNNMINFRLVNNSDSVRIGFGWYLMSDETMTLDELNAFAERHRGELYGEPPWMEAWNGIGFAVPTNSVVEQSGPEDVPTGKSLLYAYDVSNRNMYPAAFIYVGADPATEVTEPAVPVAGAVATLTFDGEIASYSGPETFDDNMITFKLVNNSDSVRIGFLWNLLGDDTVTLEDEIAYMQSHRGDNYSDPPWFRSEDWNMIDFAVGPNTIVEESVAEYIPSGKSLLFAWDQLNRIAYPAAHITVGD